MTETSSNTKTTYGFPQAMRKQAVVWSQEDVPAQLITAVALLFALFVVVTTAIIQRESYSALPWGDMWDYWIWYLKPKPNLLVRLFALHNEHRIVVARLFFLADQWLFHGRAAFIFISIFVVQFCHAILLWRLAVLAQPRRKTFFVFIGLTAFIFLFSAEQYTNFTWAFQIQFVTVYLAATSAFASLMVFARLSAETLLTSKWRSRLWLGIAMVMGITAAYSMANGLLVWPLLVLEALWFGLGRKTRALLLCVWIVIWTLYLWHYRTPPQTSSMQEGLYNLPQSFAFALCVLGSPLSTFITEVDKVFSVGSGGWELIFTAFTGLVGVVVAICLWTSFLCNRRKASGSEAVILHLLLFVLATSFLIGLGRANFPLRDALQSRYTTPALLFWFCILFLSLSMVTSAQQTDHGRSLLWSQLASLIVISLAIILNQPTLIRPARDAVLYLRESEAAIGAPVYDDKLWGRDYYNPKAMIPVVSFFRQKHLSIFAPSRMQWIGEPLSSHYRYMLASNCTGHIDVVNPITEAQLPGLRIQGWAWDSHVRAIASSIVLTNNQERILGFGYTGFGRPDVPIARPDIGIAVGWTAYLPGLNHDSINAYMVSKDGVRVCLIGTYKLPLSPDTSR